MSSGESVYHLIPPPEEKIVKPPLYRSKYPGDAPPTGSTFGLKGTSKFIANVGGEFVDPDDVGPHKTKKSGGLYGTGTARRNPNSFTKKREKDIVLPEKKRFVRQMPVPRKPAIPSKHEKPLMGLKSSKDYVTENAVEAILQVPKRPHKEEIDYLRKEDFGQTPAYLHEVKNEVEEEKEYVREMQQEMERARMDTGMRLLTKEEKDELLDGLKGRWQEVHDHYQTISLAMHTLSQKQSKEADEREIERLEKEIDRLSKDEVWVYDDSM